MAIACAPSGIWHRAVGGAGEIANPNGARLSDGDGNHEGDGRDLVGDRHRGQRHRAEQPDQESDRDKHAGLGNDGQPDGNADAKKPRVTAQSMTHSRWKGLLSRKGWIKAI